ncbi:MAG TPA: hypothetical protein VK083_19145 [Nocardia sp.]|nr:hypothetical protein [Nocardia sp.]
MKHHTEPMLDVVNGDVGMSRHLTKALKIISETPGIDEDLRKQLGDIMTGKASFRDLARSESFTRLTEAAMPKIAADLAGQTPEKIQALARAGEAILQRYREQAPDGCSQIHEDEPGSAGHQAGQAPSAAPNDETNSSGASAARYVVPGTRKPDRDQLVTPDEPDDDDIYYQERHRHGWLE